jgi:hypothetical protein
MTGAVLIHVTARVERSRKGRRVRVRADDGRAVQCSAAWRVTIGAERVAILAHDAGAHWRMAGAGAVEVKP